jgi:hypothetical protein
MMMCIAHNNNIIQVDCNEKFIRKDSMVFKDTENCSGMNTDILTTESGLKVIEFPRQSFLNFVPFSTVYAVKPRLSKVLSRPFYGALHFLCGKDFCHLQRAKYHRWKNPPVTSLFTLKAEAVTLSVIIEGFDKKIILYSQG